MSNVGPDAIRRLIVALLHEADSEPDVPYRMITDHEGLRDTLERLSVEQAEHLRSDGDVASSIHAHVDHLSFAFAAWTAWLHGSREQPNWTGSWPAERTRTDTWETSKQRLAAAIHSFELAVTEVALAQEENFAGAVAAVVHMAYHIGMIRASLPET